MAMHRRGFLKTVGVSGLGAIGLPSPRAANAAPQAGGGANRSLGVLVDIPNCIGCRKCEFACQEAAGFHPPAIETFDDKTVFSSHRRPDPRTYTTVNQFPNPRDPAKPAYVKANCLHCQDPACVSACLVGALQKEANGAVTYDAWKCMGCRYCMVACPFQIPAYEYDNALTPQVRKCTFCFERTVNGGGAPACVKICPNDALIFGPRDQLLETAREKIRTNPDVYVNHIYGENEAGGTNWLYLSSVPFEKLGFLSVPFAAPPRLTEAIQHGVFKFFIPPLALYGLLGLIMRMTRSDRPRELPPLATGDADSSEPHARGNGREGTDDLLSEAGVPRRLGQEARS